MPEKRESFPNDNYLKSGGHIYADLYAKTKKELETKIANVFNKWPAAGFGTRILLQPTQLPDGYWWAKIIRWHNCD